MTSAPSLVAGSTLSSALLIRGVSLGLAIVIAWYLPTIYFTAFFVILGQGHYLLAYRYQIETGKWNLVRTATFIALAIALFSMRLYISLDIFIYIIVVAFLIHAIFDEMTLLRKKPSLFRLLEALPAGILFAAIIGQALFHTSLFLYASLISGLIALWYLVLAYKARRKPDELSWVYFAWLLTTLAANIFLTIYSNVNPLILYKGLILIHFFIWYEAYWQRVKGNTAKKVTYLYRVLVVNSVLFILGLFWLAHLVPFADILFGAYAFYAWTLLHVLASFRMRDFKTIFKLT